MFMADFPIEKKNILLPLFKTKACMATMGVNMAD